LAGNAFLPDREELRHTDGSFGVSHDDKQHTMEHKPLQVNQRID
jgi:hypothetical protein